MGIQRPDGGVGDDGADLANGGNGYVPISLQYEPYTATTARAVSLAGGSPLQDFTNRTYKDKTVNTVVSESVNQTLARSINTSLTTVLPLVAIVLFGGSSLKFFALTLIVGFIAGAYSSIFIASTLLAAWRSRGASSPNPPTDSSPQFDESDSPSLESDPADQPTN